ARADRAFLHGGDPAENAAILRAILSGERGPRRDAVVLNTAPGLVAAGIAEDIPGGILLAAESLDSGAALAKLEALIRFTNDGRWR
ncbi:MAG TPA: anthranilate phosphoribosyltransferase, partial [Candidatus Hydrogenedentes bacterium]|nr:anthranilate phosphoribosyltransferase [Candidatus Hydrogenedentota bacterium]